MDTAPLTPVRADLSLGELQALNLDTLRACSAVPPEERFALAERVRHAAVSAGAWIENPVDRDAAQSILDYWTAQIGSLPDHQLPELLRIAPFDKANGEQVRDAAAQAYESLAEGPQTAARVLLLRLLGLHDPTIDDGANIGVVMRARAFLSRLFRLHDPTIADVTSETDLTAARDAFAQAGILRPGADGELAVAHPALLKSYWAMLTAWLAEHDLEMAKLAAVAAGANAWDQAKRQDSYLPIGAKLIANTRYRRSSDLIAAYIAAAERARVRRLINLAIVVVACAVAVSAIWWIRPLATLTAEQTKAALSNVTGDQLTNFKDQVAPSVDADSDDNTIVPKDEVLTGYLWLGSTDVPMLQAANASSDPTQAPRLLDPLTLKTDGTPYIVRTNVYLRHAFPNQGTYKSAAPVGVLDEGARVVLTGPVRGYQRPSGIQYWAPVRQIVRASIQYDGGDESIATLMKLLAPSGFVLPAAQKLPVDRNKLEIVYYHDSDRPYAEALMRRLVAMQGDNARIKPVCTFLGSESDKNAVGVIDARIDLDALLPGNAPRLRQPDHQR